LTRQNYSVGTQKRRFVNNSLEETPPRRENTARAKLWRHRVDRIIAVGEPSLVDAGQGTMPAVNSHGEINADHDPCGNWKQIARERGKR
jgi:hypothetical protein